MPLTAAEIIAAILRLSIVGTFEAKTTPGNWRGASSFTVSIRKQLTAHIGEPWYSSLSRARDDSRRRQTSG
jgi:hypothetical protein